MGLYRLPLLGVGYPRRVEPISQLIGGPSRVVPDQGCSEVLGDAYAFTLCDEPLAGGVENGPVQLWMSLPEFYIPLHNPLHSEVREQPARPWESSIQQPLQNPMQFSFAI